jgi:hypothetical protein
MPKPNDLYVGVVDIFSILLPGALLSFALASIESVRNYPAFNLVLGNEVAARWAAFIVTSYAFGHLLFLLSGQLDVPYNAYRQRRWPAEADYCYKQATKLRCRYFGTSHPPSADNPMNTFKWAKAFLLLAAPAALAEVHRFEADSKFFRSMVAALPIIALAYVAAELWAIAFAAMATTPFAFLCYAERRHKCTEWAFRFVVTLDRLPPRFGGTAAVNGPSPR